jgi:hypothetical protein
MAAPPLGDFRQVMQANRELFDAGGRLVRLAGRVQDPEVAAQLIEAAKHAWTSRRGCAA